MKNTYFIFFILFISKLVYSQDIFQTDDYILKFTSNNINLVKEEKINKIKFKSFQNILNKTLSNESKEKFNSSIIDINEFILNIKINNEKIINKNYYSEIKINFNEELIIEYFNQNKISYVDHLPNKFLLIIIDENKIKTNFLSQENYFYKYFFKSENNKFKNYFIIPNLDFNDRFILNENNFFKNNYEQHEVLNNKYKTKYQIIVHSVQGNDSINITTYLLYNDTKYLIDETSNKNLNLNDFFNNINKNAINKWKQINLINTSTINQLECRININNINELSYVRALLNKNNMIKKLNLKSIKLNENIYEIYHYGEFNIFKNSLKRSRLKISLIKNYCNIKLI